MTIATNGKPDAGIQMGPGEPTVDESTMVLAAAIPLSMQPHPARVANIGFGSGLTTHTLLASAAGRSASTRSRSSRSWWTPRARASARASTTSSRIPRSHIVIEDAKTFFASSREPYDLIVSEPSNPWVSGVATLFSDEFYGRITHYLTPDGYFVQWMQVYETNLSILASVIKALAPHFGAYALYNVDDLDVLIIATKGALARNAGRSAAPIAGAARRTRADRRAVGRGLSSRARSATIAPSVRCSRPSRCRRIPISILSWI